MKSRMTFVPTCLCVLMFTLAATTHAATFTLADGSITDNGAAASATQAISPGFDIADGQITFSGTLDITALSGVNGGQFKIGLLVGNAFFSFHPGFTDAARQGAVRVLASLTSGAKLTILSPGNGSDGDLDFDPSIDGTFDFSVLVADAGSGNVDVTFTLAEGSNTQTFNTFSVAAASLGAGGGVFSSFGVGVNTDIGSATVAYTDVQAVQATVVPTPAALPAGLMLLAAFTFRPRRL
jgi:hypothetical protein